MKAAHRINEQICVSPVRLVDTDGNTVGVFPLADARRLAADAGLDLVEIAPKIRPPVCRIMDYSKFKREQQCRNGSWN